MTQGQFVWWVESLTPPVGEWRCVWVECGELCVTTWGSGAQKMLQWCVVSSAFHRLVSELLTLSIVDESGLAFFFTSIIIVSIWHRCLSGVHRCVWSRQWSSVPG